MWVILPHFSDKNSKLGNVKVCCLQEVEPNSSSLECGLDPMNCFQWIGLKNYVTVQLCWLGHQFSSVQSLSRVRLFATPWIAARQASLSITNSRSSLRLTSIESVMPSSHLILCRPLLLLPLIPSSISIFQWVSSLHEVAKVLEFQL